MSRLISSKCCSDLDMELELLSEENEVPEWPECSAGYITYAALGHEPLSKGPEKVSLRLGTDYRPDPVCLPRLADADGAHACALVVAAYN